MPQYKAWMRAAPNAQPQKPGPEELDRIVRACEDLIRDVLKPRHLPEVVEKENQSYPIDIRGEWRAGRYRFWQRYRSGWPETRGEEFDEPFVRLDRMGENSFDIYWMRHTGKWWRVHQGKTFEEAMALLRERGVWGP